MSPSDFSSQDSRSRANSTDSNSLTIAVISGGNSAEREISLRSGAAVSQALAERGHKIVSIDPAQVDLKQYRWSGVDVAFIALHGSFGEDGQVQRILADAEMPFTGSDAQASQLAFSKSASKERFLLHNVPTAPYVLIHESDSAQRIQQQANSLGYPLVVKPDTQGSSLGVSFVFSDEDLPIALTQCFHLDSFGILETAISGTEWTVGMLDDDPMPLIRIETPRPFFDFHAKYEDDATQYNFDFDVTSDVIRRIEATAQNACRALGVSGLSRVDIMLDRFNRPWVLEINTVPGLTDHSLVPKAAARMGMTLGQLCENTIHSCLASFSKSTASGLQKPGI